ncbi:sodium:solute symporter family protein [Uliginosibacterium aquaticum]|uniref:Sodium:solute symporter family protein n=1 Tax=Uliginosibacterium aquaticum TaxID=2731212 RepID=A0ABX2ID36_9RHOO|nr:sodium:solute symporter family protein [Uliginosibacterium aquaticum]NSL53623.1 sodium:solute symporter family protein [Uliginosibacterium aquaticum]
MLIAFVVLYLLVSVGIGLYAATRVKNSSDYVTAGRHLPFYITVATVFATWFGAETVLGISATFVKDGMSGIIADPFGSSAALIFFGLFFALPLYRMNLMTLGDFYRRRYGRAVEIITSIVITISYLGWVAAQISALGLVFAVLSRGQITPEWGMVIGTGVVLLYTLYGGMWSVALTDFMQMLVIVAGLLYIAYAVGDMAGGVGTVVDHMAANGKLELLPKGNWLQWVAFIAGFSTMALGSIPQQDVFQRVNSARNETGAVWGTITGGVGYFFFAFVPLFIAYSASIVAPELVATHLAEGGDSQMILPQLVLTHMPVMAQVLFFGALLSAIMSTASGTLLAPSVTFSENVLRGFMPGMSDVHFLRMTRIIVVIFTGLTLSFALNSEASIYQMVEQAYSVTLAMAFAPLAFGLYWKRATNQGAIFAIAFGGLVWISLLLPMMGWLPAPDAWIELAMTIPPQFIGLLASVAAMVAGSLLPQWLPTAAEGMRQHHGHHLGEAAHHGMAAALTEHTPPRP